MLHVQTLLPLPYKHTHHINIYTWSYPSFCLTFHTTLFSSLVLALVSYASRSSLGHCILVCLTFHHEIYRFCFIWSSGSMSLTSDIWLRRVSGCGRQAPIFCPMTRSATRPASRGKHRTTISLTIMTDGRPQTPKGRMKGFLKAPKNWLKKTFSRPHSRSTSPQPSAFRQENRGGELSSGEHAVVSLEIDPVIGASAALSQQGILHVSLSPCIKHSAQHADHRRSAQLSRSQPSSSSLPGYAVVHGSRS